MSLIVLITDESAVHLKQIKHYYWELSAGLRHLWKSYCCVYYESKVSELTCTLQILIDIVEQRREK